MRYIGKALPILILLLFAGCGESSSNNPVTPLAISEKYEGMWEGHESDADNDGITDSLPSISFYMEIKRNPAGTTGNFILTDGEIVAEQEFYPQVTNDSLKFSVLLADTLNVSFAGYQIWHNNQSLLIMKWSCPGLDTGTVVFTRIKEFGIEDSSLSKAGKGFRITLKNQPVTNSGPELVHRYGTGKPLILIHGFGSDASTWNSMTETLRTRYPSNRFSVYTYQYDWKKSIYVLSNELKNTLDNAGIYTPVIMAHSMGGLVTRGYIAIGGRPEKSIFLGTPHDGTPMAAISRVLTFFAGGIGGDLEPGSGFINYLKTSIPPSYYENNTYNIIGEMRGKYQYVLFIPYWVWDYDYDFTLKITSNLLWKDHPKNDGIVPFTSSAKGIAATYSVSNCDHYAVNKPGQPGSPVYYIMQILNDL